jgi:hypothetical protein
MGPSEEQLAVIKSHITNNVVVDSVAGCGKTTTIKYTAMAFRQELILVLMYNINQRKNTRDEMSKLGIKNVHIHTFHSCGYRNYSQECSRDSGIRAVVSGDIPNNGEIDELYNMIIVDEVQDMNELYYLFTKKIIADLCEPDARIMILGDYMQGIYSFNGANTDYILNPAKYFGGQWMKCSLNVTFRLTSGMVDFVNAVNDSFGTGYRRLVAVKPAGRPKYYVCETNFIYKKVTEYLKVRPPHEILILAPSTRKDTKVTNLCNLLSKDGVPIYVGDRESGESMAGKLVVSTIHAIKGDERPVVMLVGFDDSILPKMLTSNINANSVIYVALTRAKEELLIFHHYTNAFIVPRTVIEQYCDFTAVSPPKKNYLNRLAKPSATKSVTDIVKFLSNDKIVECMKWVRVTQIQKPTAESRTQNTVPSKVDGSMEEVSEINGFLIPAFHSRFCFNFAKLTQYFGDIYAKTPFAGLVRKYIDEVSEFSDVFFFDPYHDIGQLLRCATIYSGLRNGLFYKIEQIRNYDWVSYEFLDECSARIASQVGESSQFEVVANRGSLVGVIDVVDGDTVYELKCTSRLEEEHILQLALYAYLMPGKKYRLYNVLTDELLKIECDAELVANTLLNAR